MSSTANRLAAVEPESNWSVLLIDDHDVFRRSLADNLRDDGHAVFEYAASGEVPPVSALSEVSVVVTDYDMPCGDGLGFADRVHAAHPSLPVVILTAHGEGTVAAQAAARGFVRLVYKPIEYHRLHQLLHALVTDASRH